MSKSSLEEIPWGSLNHAYGSAEDVPALLQQLRSADTNKTALYELFGNIWHQGTVYEATGFAVPFLVELAVDDATPDRVGILNLLAAISQGTSYLDVHQPVFEQMKVETFGAPGTHQYERQRSQELVWVEKARNAVAQAFDQFMSLAQQPDDVGFAALAVLVQLNMRKLEVLSLVHQFLISETRDLYRAGLLILIGQLRISEPNICEVLNESAVHGQRLERLAAGLAACRFQQEELNDPLRDSIIEAMCTSDVESLFAQLPWDVGEDIDMHLLSQRPKCEIDKAIAKLFSRIDAGESVKDSICLLLELLFPRTIAIQEFANRDQLTDDQLHLLKVMLNQFDNHQMHLNVNLVAFGLPESRRSLRKLVTGRPYVKLGDLYPAIAFADNLLRPRRISRLEVGDRIHSRFFGLGTITNVEHSRHYSSLDVKFDEEGQHSLSVDNRLRKYLIELGCYWLISPFLK